VTPRVFLCEPSGLNVRQRSLSDRWHERLFGLGFDIEQLRRHNYRPEPWNGLLNYMSTSHGVLVLGFAQLVATRATWRGGSPEEQQLAATWTSPWLQIEAGMAVASGLPVLVAPESQVSEGVFAANSWRGPIHGTGLETPEASVIGAWAAAVSRRADAALSTFS